MLTGTMQLGASTELHTNQVKNRSEDKFRSHVQYSVAVTAATCTAVTITVATCTAVTVTAATCTAVTFARYNFVAISGTEFCFSPKKICGKYLWVGLRLGARGSAGVTTAIYTKFVNTEWSSVCLLCVFCVSSVPHSVRIYEN